jgi:large subunit ribosomal protein L29
MKLDEIRGMSDADLRARVTALEEERFRLRFRGATETLEDPLRLRSVRRDVARALTVLRERELDAAKGAAKGGAKTAAKSAATRAPKGAAKTSAAKAAR